MSGLAWDFPLSQVSTFSRDTLNMIMPVIVIVLAVLLALLVIDGLTSSMLKVAAFVVNFRSGGISPLSGSDNEVSEQPAEETDDDESD
jgi:hypothetical protein